MFYILREKVCFNKKILLPNSICEQNVLKDEMLYMSYVFSTINKI